MHAAPSPLAPNKLERLGRVASATLTTQLFKLGFRNTFLAGQRAVNPGLRMVGETLTRRHVPNTRPGAGIASERV